MNKIYIVGALVLIGLMGIAVYIFSKNKSGVPIFSGNNASTTQQVYGMKNATFEIEGETVTLNNGVSHIEVASGSASKITTTYFGNEAMGDLTGDGKEDVAFLVTQNRGGSGTFFYAVAGVKTEKGYRPTNAFLIGDRIAPQSTEIRSGELIVNFAKRKEGDPMTAKPTVGASTFLSVTQDGTLVEKMP